MPTITTPRGFKLGKTQARTPVVPEFKSYLSSLPVAPKQAHYASHVTVPWQMDANGPDPSVTLPGVPEGWGGCGDCVEAGKAHFLVLGNYDEGGHEVTPATANAVVEQYCAYQDCTPEQLFTDPNTFDNGEDIQSSLTDWLTVEEYGCKLGAFAPVNISSLPDLMDGLYLGGGLVVGVQLSEANEEAFQEDGSGVWDYVAGSPVIGGHCVVLCGYWDDGQRWEAITWGSGVKVTPAFLQNQLDEAYVLVSAQAIADGKGPTGLNIAALEAMMAGLS